jgi:hypothetical protein
MGIWVLCRILEAHVVGNESLVHILSFKAIVFPASGEELGEIPVGE